MQIEDTLVDDGLPVNNLAFLNRMEEILLDGKVNSYIFLSEEEQKKFRKCLWLLNSVVFGQLATIDMILEYNILTKEEKKKEKTNTV